MAECVDANLVCGLLLDEDGLGGGDAAGAGEAVRQRDGGLLQLPGAAPRHLLHVRPVSLDLDLSPRACGNLLLHLHTVGYSDMFANSFHAMRFNKNSFHIRPNSNLQD